MRNLVLILGLLALIAAPVDAAPGPSGLSFARAKTYASGRGTKAIAIGDLNRDGRLDLVTANSTADSVSVLLSRGDGGFRPKVDYKAKSYDLPYAVAIGDLNGDGAPDLVTGDALGSLTLFTNHGDGTFASHVDLQVGGLSVAIGDLNGDGLPDLASGSGHFVAVLLNRGGGVFADGVSYQTGNYPTSIAIGDLNGDGKPDLATANTDDDTVSLLFNRGNGTVLPKRDYGVGIRPESVALGDLNGDGKPDLATANSTTKDVSVLLNNGAGSFRSGRDLPAPGGAASAAIGDVNGDGTPDLAIATGYPANAVSVWANKGGGRFEKGIAFATARSPLAVAIADLNADGRPDLATANGSNSVSILSNTPGLCVVQDVSGRKLAVARQMIERAGCHVGRVRRADSRSVKPGRVISQKPKFGAVLPGGSKVELVVSRGRRPS